jgi:hypothetical protein
MRLLTAAFAAPLVALPLAAAAQYDPPPPPNATEGGEAYNFYIPERGPTTVFFYNLMDGETVSNPVKMEFGMLGMVVAPAGDAVGVDMSGHHHLLINRTAESVTPGEPMPAGDDLIHFGDGATSAVMELPPGTHTLQLVAGDANHVPFDPMVASDPITITVAE